MLTLRAFGAASAAADNALMSLYRNALNRHWPAHRRIGAFLLGLAGIGGWSRTERAVLPPSIRAHGLSMADRRGIHRLLNPGTAPFTKNPLKNKQLFAEILSEHGLPHPQTFSGTRRELQVWLARQSDVIAKPAFGSHGRGITRWQRMASGDWHTGPIVMDNHALAASLHRIVKHGGIVQQALRAHPDLETIAPGALPTLRIVTCLDECNEAEPCACVLRLASHAGPVDNFSAGNLATPLDASGRCGLAVSIRGGQLTRSASHPSTGQIIAGVEVPFFSDALGLACKAHAIFRDSFTVIGWDVAITPNGPSMIEGNWNPGTRMIQLAQFAGLDTTRLGDLYRHHLARLSPGEWRKAPLMSWDR
ncbi:hypothetical protein MB02_16545 [Croceicoccus estronivorus]|uniref:sugar-transfer associated ATP-grasp domain-containing protein n=1 Tax=Croceicoccus estronivorus TaxID=1172626 RepID=UPI00083482A5|nr:sugar-transfer associated ATP-grasp domain-containing protein [Croceicoccus estronivorus]OCC22468.1 hypothetical protein MB02_16545 [Croceicoccus estronivorus]